MLTLHISPNKSKEYWDPIKEEFVYPDIHEQNIVLEHSLVSLSKWESKYHKPFLNDKEKKTEEELRDYIKFMTITQNVKEEIYDEITTNENLMKKINDYIQDPHTATTFYEIPQEAGKSTKRPSKEIITAELVYYWMISYQIPFSCEKWHLNNLLTLVRVCSIKNDTGKKMSKRDIMKNNNALNAARRARLHSRG